jgi:hypothetical protein
VILKLKAMKNLIPSSSVNTSSSLSNCLVRNLGIVKPNALERSTKGFLEFLSRDYVKRKGTGKFTSTASYESNLNLFLKTTSLDEFRWHRFSRLEMIQQIVRFNDLHSKSMRSDYVKNINSTMSAYMDYAKHTLGLYKPSARAAA